MSFLRVASTEVVCIWSNFWIKMFQEFRRKLRLSKGVPLDNYNQTLSSLGGTTSGSEYTTTMGSTYTDADTTTGYSAASSSGERRVRINTVSFVPLGWGEFA